MADRRVPVDLVLDDTFTGRMAAVAEAARVMGNRWALDSATWEPHDWSRF